jgi:hypothetical protein
MASDLQALLDGAGHLIPLEAPAAAVEAILGVLHLIRTGRPLT